MTLDAIEVPMPGTIRIFTPDGTEHRVMSAQMTSEGLQIQIAPTDEITPESRCVGGDDNESV
jgi:hypothetical protein